VPHAIDAHDTDIVLVFVDPESELGGALEATLEGPMRLFTLEERDALLGNLDAVGAGFDALVSWAERTLGQIAGVPVRTREVHPRVRKLLRLLRTQLADADADVSLPHLAGLVGLSEGRLVHVFSESMGIPLRRYLLWMKLQRATAAVVSGMSLGEAAAEAGFSDSAHMSRTFRRMFGMTPSALRGQFRNSSSEG
jgi:transcriptional regulator GlxA family with amidase domain